MSNNKAIAHGKEKRKPYRGAKAVDASCRNNGDCYICFSNRTHSSRKRLTRMQHDEAEHQTE